jgi:hypothetical protein
VGWGIDANNDGSISTSEVKSVKGNAASDYIAQVNYAHWVAAAENMDIKAEFALGILENRWYYSSRCLLTFLAGTSCLPADTVATMPVLPNDAGFQATWGDLEDKNGWTPMDPINVYSYNQLNGFTQALLSDPAFRSEINRLYLVPNLPAMAGTGDRTYSWTLQNQDIDIDQGYQYPWTDTDMHLSVGKFKFSGTVTFHWQDNTITAVDFDAVGRDL